MPLGGWDPGLRYVVNNHGDRTVSPLELSFPSKWPFMAYEWELPTSYISYILNWDDPPSSILFQYPYQTPISEGVYVRVGRLTGHHFVFSSGQNFHEHLTLLACLAGT